MPTNKKRVTVAMVANHAGVSRAVVYAILNPTKVTNIGVSTATRAKVENAIQELGYLPNNSARTLVSGRSHNIGLVMPDQDTPLFRNLVRGMVDTFASHGYMIFQEYHRGSASKERSILEKLFSQGVDGLIISRVNASTNSDLLERFIHCNVPVTILGADDTTNLAASCVAFDEQAVMRLLVQHLEITGAKKIGYLSFCEHQQQSGKIRQRYLENALVNSSISLAKSLEITDYTSCKNAVSILVTDKIDSIICFNDEIAHAIVNAALEMGMSIPAELQILGIDGYTAPLASRAGTSVKLPCDAFVDHCWNAFEASIERNELMPLATVSPRLVLGETTRHV